MRVKFEEGPAAVDVDELGERVERGKAVDVPDEIGEQLVKQGWVRSSGGQTKKKSDDGDEKSSAPSEEA